jgi:hypothetical protein
MAMLVWSPRSGVLVAVEIVHLVGVRPEEYSKITPAALLMDLYG